MKRILSISEECTDLAHQSQRDISSCKLFEHVYMPSPVIGTLNVERKKYYLVASLQGQTCYMYKVPKGPLRAAGMVEPKLVIGKLELCLEEEREAVCHNPLQRL